ncbi:hypothetical protein BCU90_17425 [Vibrio lentus]|uniref:hypothetical protein n=1 Tax=Vibrio lentus TaxID=136468 RepID=UPI000C821A9C|nr:hypothetical protein [Vibrio lentus]PMG45645.1 hypothetical protein BCU90_17425 [Vibrio lentus]
MAKLTNEQIDKIRKGARIGMSKAALSRYCQIHKLTLDRWLEEHPEVEQAMLEGKFQGDYEVALALHEEATGLTIDPNENLKPRNVNLLSHLSTKRLKNSEFNNDWGDALDKEETTVNVVLSEADIDKQLAELEGELTS